MNSLISADNTWALWTFLVVWSAVSIVLEQKYKWASRLTGAIIALLGAIAFANLGIIPTESAVYDSVWSYVVPVAIPLSFFFATRPLLSLGVAKFRRGWIATLLNLYRM